jgi:hypothetical protein
MMIRTEFEEEPMSSSVFTDKSIEPDASRLAEALGATAPIWSDLRDHLEAKYGPLVDEWKFYGAKSGWLKKTLRKKRNLFFFTPLEGYFRLGFMFGDRAVAVIEDSAVSDEIKEELRNARKYAEGRALVLDVRKPEDVEPVKTLVEIKLNN